MLEWPFMLEAIAAGKLNCSVECGPLLGPQLMKAVTDLMRARNCRFASLRTR